MIEHTNIFYIRDLSEIGGVETFYYELAKKYKTLDIALVYKTANYNQLKRIRQYCPTYKHTNEKIKCKVAIINYDISIINYINEDAKIYQVIHGDYENPAYTCKPPTHNRIYKYIGITKHIVNSFKRITGQSNVVLGYNPLTIPKDEKPIILVSATRLSKVKGKDRMIKLAQALDEANINYIWYIFTNDTKEIINPNIMYLKPRLDVNRWICQADYVVQLSDTEACSYTINEALYRNIPIIVTPLPYLKEIGVEDNKNAYILDFDCNNIKDIVNKINNKLVFNFKPLQDNYNKILQKSVTTYDKNKIVLVYIINSYTDLKLNRFVNADEVLEVSVERAEELIKGKVAKAL